MFYILLPCLCGVNVLVKGNLFACAISLLCVALWASIAKVIKEACFVKLFVDKFPRAVFEKPASNSYKSKNLDNRLIIKVLTKSG